jgi:hypothetical protein
MESGNIIMSGLVREQAACGDIGKIPNKREDS